MCFLLGSAFTFGAVAQMGERMTGSHEVRGSIPLSSTKDLKRLVYGTGLFLFVYHAFSSILDIAGVLA